MRKTANILSEIDVLVSLSNVADNNNLVRPTLNNEKKLEISLYPTSPVAVCNFFIHEFISIKKVCENICFSVTSAILLVNQVFTSGR